MNAVMNFSDGLSILGEKFQVETKDKPDDESLVHFSQTLMNYKQNNLKDNLVTFFVLLFVQYLIMCLFILKNAMRQTSLLKSIASQCQVKHLTVCSVSLLSVSVHFKD